MIELTVKTLDSQNHAFSVDDDITVAQFKEKIEETISIPADTQRIIYCGRVLQDSVKLNDYGVNGKVVHLVQRAPPSANPRSNRAASPQPQRRHFRGPDHGNALYLGSMAFPSNLMESQGFVPPPPTHTLAASRLNVAKRMLRRAEAVIGLLENPTERNVEQSPPEETQEEVTPVFEARLIVPSDGPSEPIDDAIVLSAVHNSLLNSGAIPVDGAEVTVEQEEAIITDDGANIQENIDSDTPPLHSASVTPEEASPTNESIQNIADDAPGTSTEQVTENASPNAPATNGTATANGPVNTLAENASHTSEMANLLDTLSRLQTRFAPFLERYHNFMREDPVVPDENTRQVQAIINRVSEILHLFGHAYHSLSDIIVRVRTPPSRPLLCRPILIQHSAVVQAGIPIQVEAQINFAPDRPNATAATAPQVSQQSENPMDMAAGQAPSNGTGADTTAPVTTAASTAPTSLSQTVIGFPLMPGAGLHMQTFPIQIGIPHGRSHNINVTVTRPNLQNSNATRDAVPSSEAQPSRVSSSSINVSTTRNGTAEPCSGTTPDVPMPRAAEASPALNTAGGTVPPGATLMGNTGAHISEASFNVPGFNNPNVEFFMEVTPESITIDSLETALVGSNQAGDLLRGAFNGPPPELLQTIIQAAGQIINRGGMTTNPPPPNAAEGAQQPTAPPAETAAADTQTTQTSNINTNTNQPIPVQNSQARGNTQTNPTTSTHTRSTSRPHVHLAQHAMQGFDPFLPCNSHHVTHRRRIQAQNAAQQAVQNGTTRTAQPSGTAGNSRDQQNNNNQNANLIYNIIQGIIGSIRNAYNQRASGQSPPTTSTSTSSTGSSSTSSSVPNTEPLPPFSTFLPHLQNINLSDPSHQGPTIAHLLQQLPDDTYVEGESIFTDLVMLLSRNFTLNDIVQLNSGRLEPLMRIRSVLRNFFLFRVLDGSMNNAAVERGVNRLTAEIQPFLDSLGQLECRENIDIVRSTQSLFRARLPNIVSLAASRSPNSLRMLIDQCRITARHLCALVISASSSGQRGVEVVFTDMLVRYMQGIPREIQQWTVMTTRSHLRQLIANLNVPQSILQPHIVRTIDFVTTAVSDSARNVSDDVESMEVDEQEAGSSEGELGTTSINLTADGEPLPPVVLGSESWHGQVPSDWVPIIARDTQKQRRQSSQPPFSDAYLSGMPSKRRKIVSNSKPQGSLPQVITESVRRAVTAVGLASVAPVETVAQSAGTDINVQAAYRDMLRTRVQAGLNDNEDFTPDRFPNASNYFNSPQ